MPTVLVIGASRGIGLEFVQQYVQHGARVIATARDENGLARLRDAGAQALRVDVADPASVGGLSSQLDGEKLDVALYVAGVYPQGDAHQPPAQPAFDQAMHTNVLGAMQVIPRVAPLVEEARGKFVFITSGMGRIADVSSSFAWVYRTSKAALNMAVAAAQNDYPKAVMVAMSPGWVKTDMGGAGATLTAEHSVSSMRTVISTLTAKHRGTFLDYDGRNFGGW